MNDLSILLVSEYHHLATIMMPKCALLVNFVPFVDIEYRE
jgi:hypothetical protein